MKQQYTDLMNQELDGMNSPAESRQLAEHLAGDEEARLCFQELRLVLQFLAEADRVTPPTGQRQSIMATISDLPPRVGPTISILSRCREFCRPVRVLTFATGAMFALIVLAALTHFPTSQDNARTAWLQGTSNVVEFTNPGADTIIRPIILPGVTGNIAMQGQKTGTAIRLQINSNQGARVRLGCDPQTDLLSARAAEADGYSLAADGQSIELRLQGSGEYYFDFKHTDKTQTTIKIDILTEGGAQAHYTAQAGIKSELVQN